MEEKKVILKITKAYCKKYRINDDFSGKEIVIYNYSYKHMEKHKNEYFSFDSYNNAINGIADIIKTPDFVTVNNKNGSLNLIKKLEKDNVLVAITIDLNEDGLFVKTMFPIREFKYRVLKEKSL